MRHKLWLVAVFDRNHRGYTNELAEQKKKYYGIITEAALVHRIVHRWTRHKGPQHADIDRLECNRLSLYVSLSPGNLFLIDLRSHNMSNHIVHAYAHNVII